MLLLCASSIYPHYYGWWCLINYANEENSFLWSHQVNCCGNKDKTSSLNLMSTGSSNLLLHTCIFLSFILTFQDSEFAYCFPSAWHQNSEQICENTFQIQYFFSEFESCHKNVTSWRFFILKCYWQLKIKCCRIPLCTMYMQLHHLNILPFADCV